MGYLYIVEDLDTFASQDQRYQKQSRRTWKVKVDLPTYGAIYGASHPLLPKVWSRHPEDNYLILVKLSSQRDGDDPTLFHITGEYTYYADAISVFGNPQIDQQQQGLDPSLRVDNPLFRPNDYQVSTVTRPWATFKAWDLTTGTYTKSILNSAGDPYLPPVEINKSGCTIAIGLNSLTAPSGFWLSAVDYVNANNMIIGPYTFAVGQLKLSSITANLVYENGISYWRWGINFEYRPTWQLDLIDQGRRQLYTFPPRVPVLAPICDPITGQSVSQPVLLDGNGVQLAPGGNPVYNTFHIYPRIVFPSPM